MDNMQARRDFARRSKSIWRDAIRGVFDNSVPENENWYDISQIRSVLDDIAVSEIEGDSPVEGRIGGAYMFHPISGSTDLGGAEQTQEQNTIYFRTHPDPARSLYYIVKPARLTFRLPVNQDGSPSYEWAYFWLELDDLEPTGILDDEQFLKSYGYEPLCEIRPGEYKHIEVWEQGFDGYDEGGSERSLPGSARPVKRYLRGAFVIFCKGSYYNLNLSPQPGSSLPATTAALHEKIGETKFDQLINQLAKNGGFTIE